MEVKNEKGFLGYYFYCFCGFLFGCQGGSANEKELMLKDLFSSKYFESLKEPTLEAGLELDFEEEINLSESRGVILAFDNYVFYNIMLNKRLELEDFPGDAISYKVYWQYILISNNDMHFVYSVLDGSLLFSETKTNINYSFNDDDFELKYLDDEGYEIKSASYYFEDFILIEDSAFDQNYKYDYEYREYRYVVESENYQYKVMKDDQTYHVIQFQDGYSLDRWHLLENGNLLFVRRQQVPSDSKDFDIIISSKKYLVKNELFILESKKLVELDLDIYVSSVRFGDEIFKPIGNLVYYYGIDPISKELYPYNSKTKVFDNEMKNSQVIKFQHGEIDLSKLNPIDEDNFIYQQKSSIYLLSGTNQIKKEITGRFEDFNINVDMNGDLILKNRSNDEYTIFNIEKENLVATNLERLEIGLFVYLFKDKEGNLFFKEKDTLFKINYTNFKKLIADEWGYFASFYILYNDDIKDFDLYYNHQKIGSYKDTEISISTFYDANRIGLLLKTTTAGVTNYTVYHVDISYLGWMYF